MVIAVCSFALALHPDARRGRHRHRLGRRRRRSGRPRPRRSSPARSTRTACGSRAAPLPDAGRRALRRAGRARPRAPIDDVRGSAAYRRHALAVLARRTLTLGLGRATGGGLHARHCTVNGERREADDVWEGESLLYVLRERLGLPGSKNACEQGECGSCSVYLDGVLVCACLVAAGAGRGPRGRHRRGPAPTGDELHPVQQAFVEAGAVQCGFCTPGLVVASARPARAQRRARRDPEIREALAGNLCRCTGYEKILDAVRLAAGGMGRDAQRDAHVIEGCAIATVDAGRHRARRRPRRASRATGSPRSARAPRPSGRRRDRRIDGARLPRHARASSTATTTSTSGPRAGSRSEATLFEWLVALYPVWAQHRRRGRVRRPRAPGWPRSRARAARRATDHHYVFPRDAGDLLAVEIEAARVGSACASTRAAARWTSGSSDGGLPPDEVVEDRDAILAASEAAIDRFHDPAPGRDGADRARAVLAVLGDRAS